MINLTELQKLYPYPAGFDRSALREYFQYKIMDILFRQGIGNKLCFLGGTAIKFCYGGRRYSEDLDFDNRGISPEEFEALVETVGQELGREGYRVDVRNSFKNAFRSRVGIEGVYHDNGLSPLPNEKLMIQIDMAPQDFAFEPQTYMLQKYEVLRTIAVVPVQTILSQKVAAVIGRKRAKGRDFYDIVYLRGFTEFDFSYLKDKLGIVDVVELKKKLLEVTAGFDFDALATDVMPFLVNREEVEYVRQFRTYIEQKL